MQQQSDETIQSLERTLSKLETSLNEHYCNVGKQFLELAEQECQVIGDLVDEIIEIKQQLSQLHQTAP
jgi:uncharacterized protein YfbU (UPF0304 family)